MEPHETELAEREFVGVRELTKIEEIGNLFDRALPQIFGFLGWAGVEPEGPPLGIYYSISDEGLDMVAAVPVAKPIEESGELTTGTLPGGRAVTHTYVGHYDGLAATWIEFNQAVDDAAHRRRSPSWEDYVIGPPDQDDPSKWETVLVQPIV